MTDPTILELDDDDELLAAVLRRFIKSDEYLNAAGGNLTIDGNVDLTDAEAEVIERLYLEAHPPSAQPDAFAGLPELKRDRRRLLCRVAVGDGRVHAEEVGQTVRVGDVRVGNLEAEVIPDDVDGVVDLVIETDTVGDSILRRATFVAVLAP